MTETYGQSIRRRRIACGLSQQDLADLAGVAKSTLRNVETGRVSVPRLADEIEGVLTRAENGAMAAKASVDGEGARCLVYVAGDGSRHLIDADRWSPDSLHPSDRAVCRALPEYVLSRFDEEVSP